jgi:cytochrome c-type biogenesis protein CcmF
VVVFLMKPGALKQLLPAAAALVVAVAIMAALGVVDMLHVLFVAAAALAIGSNLVRVAVQLSRQWRAAGGAVAHLGFAILMIGVLASSAYTSDDRLVLPRGQAETALGVRLSYQGMRHDVMTARNELILGLDDGSGEREVRPRLYYAERLNGIMRNPYIDRTLLSDLYLAPQQVIEEELGSALTLRRGESRQVGDLTLTFDGFQAPQHGESGGPMRIDARVIVAGSDAVDTLWPGLEVIADEAGNPLRQSRPAVLEKDSLTISLDRVLADDGAVVISVLGLEEGSPETLVLEISRKPLINLVWLGAILITLGGCLAYVRRSGEQGR